MLNIGILDAFPPDKIKIDWDTTPVDAYIRFLEQTSPPFSYTGYAITQGEFPATLDACDAYLITGSPRGVYDPDPWIAQLMEFIRASFQAGKRLVGICFGHQILAHALGGCAAKSEKGWGLGLKTFNINVPKIWMNAVPDSCALYFVHQDQVTQLPPEAELLGGNDFCPNLFFSIDNQVFGIQGHPEFTPGLMRAIVNTRKRIVGAEPYVQALDSLDSGTPDNRLFAQWIANFLTS